MKNISVKTKKASQVTCLFVLINQEQPNDCCNKKLIKPFFKINVQLKFRQIITNFKAEK